MRRFSQRNHLVTLSDINITPLLDLAFVLLIIFIITTPLLEQSVDMNLPVGGRESPRMEKQDFRTVEIDNKGRYSLDRRERTLDEIERELGRVFLENSNLVVRVRGDKASDLDYFVKLTDRLQGRGIYKIALQTKAPRN